MTKQKKKRSKAYSGIDATISRPIITHISAANRSSLGQWWFDRKGFLKPALIAALVAIIVAGLIFELVRVISGA